MQKYGKRERENGKQKNTGIREIRENKLIWTTRQCEVENKCLSITERREIKNQMRLKKINGLSGSVGKRPTRGFFDGTFFAGAHLTTK